MRWIFLAPFVVLCSFCLGQVPDYVPVDGLEAWYAFDGNAEDASDNANHLNAIGEMEWGSINGTLFADFPGDGQFFYHPDFDFPATTEMTISFWIRIDAWSTSSGIGGVRPMVSKHLSGPDGTFVMHPTSTTINQAGPHDWELGEWHHVIRVYAFERAVYFDGELISEGDGEYLNLTTYPFMVGGWLTGDLFEHPYGPNGLTFDGGFHSMGIWNRALTSEEAFAVFLQTPILAGCTDELACNYVPDSNVDDGSCEYPEIGYDCDGVCLNDADGDGVCDEFEIVGCQDPLACNFFADATDDGDCDYTCCPGPGCCDTGTTWDYEIAKCVPINSCPEDLDYDGIIGVEDLLTLLSSFGTPCDPSVDPPVAEWTCGDPSSYHGYDYETVLIGEQCWFAENLRTELYLNGEEIPSGLDRETWCNATYGATTYYAETADSCISDPSVNFPGVPCENPEGALEFYGRLYNWHAVNDERELCPSGWHVPSSAEWLTLKEYVDASYPYHSGLVLREHGSWRNPVTGLDLFGFKLRPGGYRNDWNGDGSHYRSAGRVGTWFWTTENGSDEGTAYSFDHKAFNEINSLVLQNLQGPSQNQHQFGFSVRCIKD